MCGIAGVISKNYFVVPDEKKIKHLMRSRGPDKQDSFIANNNGLSLNLYASRLKILDIDERSNQPFKHDEFILIYNGEIYNYLEIRKELEELGYIFKTKSDTEVLIQAYKKWGIDCIKKFDGMWSFCIYDQKKNKIILSRDFFGEKPLFVFFDNNTLIFGSEIKYLFFFDKKLNNLNYDKIENFLLNGYKSLYKNNDTFFKKISFVKPGEVLELELNNFKLTKKKYFPFKKIDISSEEKINTEHIKKTFIEDYKKRLRSDVPISFCLSGGIDSSTLVSIAKKQFNLRPFCFSIINKDKRYNESENINFLEKELNLDVHYIKIPKLSYEDFLNKCKDLIKYRSSPIATISYYIHSYISYNCAKKGFKVIFSGTGADEIFAGYYDHTLYHLNEIKHEDNFKSELKSWNDFIGINIRNKKLIPKNFINNPNFRDHIYNDKEETKIFKIKKRYPFQEKIYDDNNLKNRMMNELFNEAVPVILYEDDMNSMMHSIENRSPFLTQNLVNLLNSLPSKKYIKNGYTKKILRDIAKEYLPDKIRLERKKVGFNSSILDVAEIKYEEFISSIKSNNYLKEIINFKDLEFLKNSKSLTNSESKLIFNIINIKILTEEFN
ncbi:asparagine synthase (glutamine-hydrolyzing) [Candidatus Pelagibacter sp.]|nr:asparagine synthase (glutamine-hydrolyzing) [Candidatus Pelagibacter sp.]|tara:strand:+ start:1766 stop:3592 length:1827 start_codon:yes stop_codon:yes gene_type:complete